MSRQFKDLSGERRGKLTIIEPIERYGVNGATRTKWLCKCDCGNEVEVLSGNINRKFSCGCDKVSKKINDYTGQRFGMLTAIAPTKERRNNQVVWLCKCDCGNTKTIVGSNLKNHKGGCKDCFPTINKTHGLTKTSIYECWRHFKSRCDNPNNPSYCDYGARGITYCSEWANFEPFYLWAIENGYVEGLSLDRIDVNGNYEPDNCRWITNEKQQRNKRCTIMHNDMPLIEYVEQIGRIDDYRLIYERVRRQGMTVEEAITKPVRGRN